MFTRSMYLLPFLLSKRIMPGKVRCLRGVDGCLVGRWHLFSYHQCYLNAELCEFSVVFIGSCVVDVVWALGR